MSKLSTYNKPYHWALTAKRFTTAVRVVSIVRDLCSIRPSPARSLAAPSRSSFPAHTCYRVLANLPVVAFLRFSISYMDESGASGVLVSDAVSVAGLTVPQQTFAAVSSEIEGFSDVSLRGYLCRTLTKGMSIF